MPSLVMYIIIMLIMFRTARDINNISLKLIIIIGDLYIVFTRKAYHAVLN